MKRNMKFFTIVISLLFLSTIVLTGCMLAIASDNGEMKPYDLNVQKDSSEDDGGKAPGHILEDAPLPQESWQAKFEAMYDISEDGKSITVISKDYLNNYWQSNYEKEVIKSLTTEEVYFIIQDSIRIYEEYDEVVLTAFGSVSSQMQVAKRFPFIKDDTVINTGSTDSNYCFYLEEDISNIYKIIMYRLTALSSPKAFITGEEAIRFVGKEPGIFSSMLPWTTIYIPNYSESTDRDYILQTVGYAVNSNSNYVDVDKCSDLFCFCDKSGASITFEAKANRQSTKVYPTLEMEKQGEQSKMSGADLFASEKIKTITFESAPPGEQYSFHGSSIYQIKEYLSDFEFVRDFSVTTEFGANWIMTIEYEDESNEIITISGTKTHIWLGEFKYRLNSDSTIQIDDLINRLINVPRTEQNRLTLTIAETLPSCAAFEYRVPYTPDCFYAYDAERKLYRVLWTDWNDLNEKDKVVVEYSNIKTFTYPEFATGWSPQYEVTAISVKKEINPEDHLVSHIQIKSGDNTIRPFGSLLWSKTDNGDGTFTELIVDMPVTEEIVNLYADVIPKLVLNESVSYSVQVNGQVEKVYLLTPTEDWYSKSETTFDSLSNLENGTYYVVFNVLLSGNCDPDAPQHSYRYEDVFCLVVDNKDTNHFIEFSFEDDKVMFPSGTPGVKIHGFNNVTESPINTYIDAIEQAKNECTIEWNDTQVYYDTDTGIWKVMFYTKEFPGGDQNVYLGTNGKTFMIVYGE